MKSSLAVTRRSVMVLLVVAAFWKRRVAFWVLASAVEGMLPVWSW